MTTDWGAILSALQGMGEIGFLVFLRVGAAMAVLPAFGERSIPERLRLVLALSFTAVVAPAVAPAITERLADASLAGLIAPEVIVGLAIGLVIRLFVLALQTAGSIAAQSTSLSQLFGGGAVDAQPAIGHLMLVAGLALAVMGGLHVRLASFLILSYDLLSFGVFPNAADLSQWGIGQVAQSFALAFSLAAPFVIASLIYNVALGVINRAMPQLMVAFVGAPAITLGGLLLLLLALPALLGVWSGTLTDFLSAPIGTR